MNTKYIDLIDQTYHFPQEEFQLDGEYVDTFNEILNSCFIII